MILFSGTSLNTFGGYQQQWLNMFNHTPIKSLCINSLRKITNLTPDAFTFKAYPLPCAISSIMILYVRFAFPFWLCNLTILCLEFLWFMSGCLLFGFLCSSTFVFPPLFLSRGSSSFISIMSSSKAQSYYFSKADTLTSTLAFPRIAWSILSSFTKSGSNLDNSWNFVTCSKTVFSPTLEIKIYFLSFLAKLKETICPETSQQLSCNKTLVTLQSLSHERGLWAASLS